MSAKTPDLTHKQRPAGVGMDTKVLFLCGHRVQRQRGAVVRNGLLLRCAGCAQGRVGG